MSDSANLPQSNFHSLESFCLKAILKGIKLQKTIMTRLAVSCLLLRGASRSGSYFLRLTQQHQTMGQSLLDLLLSQENSSKKNVCSANPFLRFLSLTSSIAKLETKTNLKTKTQFNLKMSIFSNWPHLLVMLRLKADANLMYSLW